MASTYANHAVSIGGIFGRAFNVISRSPVATIGIPIFLWGLPQTAIPLLELDRPDAPAEAALLLTIITLIITFAMTGVVQGASITAAGAAGEGRRASILASVVRGIQVTLPLFVMALISAIGIMIGLVVLVVPGIIVLMMWSVAGPVRVLGGVGIFAAFERSRALTRGNRVTALMMWLILLALWIALFAIAVIFIIIAAAIGFTTEATDPATIVITGAMLGVMLGVTVTTQTAFYLELGGEGAARHSEGLAEIFA